MLHFPFPTSHVQICFHYSHICPWSALCVEKTGPRSFTTKWHPPSLFPGTTTVIKLLGLSSHLMDSSLLKATTQRRESKEKLRIERTITQTWLQKIKSNLPYKKQNSLMQIHRAPWSLAARRWQDFSVQVKLQWRACKVLVVPSCQHLACRGFPPSALQNWASVKKMSLNSPGSILLAAKWKDATLSAQNESEAWFSYCGISFSSVHHSVLKSSNKSLNFSFH